MFCRNCHLYYGVKPDNDRMLTTQAFFVIVDKPTEWYPSGKGLVCKTIIGRFDSYPLLSTEGCLFLRQPFVFHPVEAKLRGVFIYWLVRKNRPFFITPAWQPRHLKHHSHTKRRLGPVQNE